MICPQCGETCSDETGNRRKRFCSPTCAKARAAEMRRLKLALRPCANPGCWRPVGEGPATGRHPIYCGDACRLQAERARQLRRRMEKLAVQRFFAIHSVSSSGEIA